MSRKLLLQRRGEIEPAEAVDWYEARGSGLGADFLLEFDAAIARILDNPFLYQVIEDGIRRAPLHRFPYGLMYEVSERELVVLTCFHGNRDPREWRELCDR